MKPQNVIFVNNTFQTTLVPQEVSYFNNIACGGTFMPSMPSLMARKNAVPPVLPLITEGDTRSSGSYNQSSSSSNHEETRRNSSSSDEVSSASYHN